MAPWVPGFAAVVTFQGSWEYLPPPFKQNEKERCNGNYSERLPPPYGKDAVQCGCSVLPGLDFRERSIWVKEEGRLGDMLNCRALIQRVEDLGSTRSLMLPKLWVKGTQKLSWVPVAQSKGTCANNENPIIIATSTAALVCPGSGSFSTVRNLENFVLEKLYWSGGWGGWGAEM